MNADEKALRKADDHVAWLALADLLEERGDLLESAQWRGMAAWLPVLLRALMEALPLPVRERVKLPLADGQHVVWVRRQSRNLLVEVFRAGEQPDRPRGKLGRGKLVPCGKYDETFYRHHAARVCRACYPQAELPGVDG